MAEDVPLMDFAGIGFVQPLGMAALVAVPPAWALLRLEARRRAAADRAYGGAPALRRGQRATRRGARSALLLTALALLALAVARPTWGRGQVPLVRRGIDVVIALDVSRSMAATDVAPTRAGAAVAGIERLLRALPGDRVGLVTFAGTAFQRSPLTLDLDAVAQLASQAQGEAALVDPGTDLAAALETALTTLEVEDRAETQVIVLVSDGEHVGRPLDTAIRRAADAGVRVYTVAAGTEAGAPLPAGAAGAAGGEDTRLDLGTLQRIAGETDGSVRRLESLAGLAVEFSRLRQTTFAGEEEEAAIERFQWFLGGALLLLVAESALGWLPFAGPVRRRRLALATSLLAGLTLAGCAGTEAWREVHAGNEAFGEGRYEDALAAYGRAETLAPEEAAIPYNRGNALHALRRYDEATVASAAAAERAASAELRRHATYALGNHAFRRADLDAAREAYTEVLLSDPADEDARHNLELVLLLQQAQQQRQEPQPPQGGATPSPTPPGDPEQGEDGDGAPPRQPEATPGDGQPGGAPSATPGAGGQPPTGQPGGGAGAGAGGPQTPEEAEAALAQALQGLGEQVSIEEALAVLDRLRQLNALRQLDEGRRGGTLPDR